MKKNFEELKGKTLSSITGGVGDELMIFKCVSGEIYELEYHHDCCATCSIEDICGDLEDLIGNEIFVAEVVEGDLEPLSKYDESYSWVFYKLDTIKGGVTIRWYGESNGYYSETASFSRRPV